MNVIGRWRGAALDIGNVSHYTSSALRGSLCIFFWPVERCMCTCPCLCTYFFLCRCCSEVLCYVFMLALRLHAILIATSSCCLLAGSKSVSAPWTFGAGTLWDSCVCLQTYGHVFLCLFIFMWGGGKDVSAAHPFGMATDPTCYRWPHNIQFGSVGT